MNSYWRPWSEWGGCSATCGNEMVNITKVRRRGCTEPQNGGQWIECTNGVVDENIGLCPPLPCPIGKLESYMPHLANNIHGKFGFRGQLGIVDPVDPVF